MFYVYRKLTGKNGGQAMRCTFGDSANKPGYIEKEKAMRTAIECQKRTPYENFKEYRNLRLPVSRYFVLGV